MKKIFLLCVMLMCVLLASCKLPGTNGGRPTGNERIKIVPAESTPFQTDN